MNWTTARELKAQLARLWDRGELLRWMASQEQRFPLRLVLRGPTSADLTDRFEVVRLWASEMASLAHARIEWRDVRHRVQGDQRVPAQIWIDSLDAALVWLGRRGDAERFVRMTEATRAMTPSLLPWLSRRPLEALAIESTWPQLLAVVRWAIEHPRPGVYLREVDAPGVHSKFIEQHRVVLAELFDMALAPDAIDPAYSGAAHFAARYGFRDKPIRIRFRLLDDRLIAIPGTRMADVTLDASSFAAMRLGVRRVVITENETNFLAVPSMDDSIAVFGAGYGWDALARARWLDTCDIRYWGDIDTHGFAILDALRARLPHAGSLLMDRETLLAHVSHWTVEPQPVRHDLSRLDAAEQALYDDLRHDRLGSQVRLEQERIGYEWVRNRLGATPRRVD